MLKLLAVFSVAPHHGRYQVSYTVNVPVDLLSWTQKQINRIDCPSLQRPISQRIAIDFPVTINTKIIECQMIKCWGPQAPLHDGFSEPSRVTMATPAVWQSLWQRPLLHRFILKIPFCWRHSRVIPPSLSVFDALNDKSWTFNQRATSGESLISEQNFKSSGKICSYTFDATAEASKTFRTKASIRTDKPGSTSNKNQGSTSTPRTQATA